MTRFLRALLLCAVCVSPAYAGDQSGIEPKTKAVSPSFSPPITPTISGGIVGEKVSFSVDIDASGPAAESLRVSIDSALRVEIGSAEAKPAFRSRVEVPARVSPTSGVIRSVQLGLPLSGAGMWRLSNFQF